MSVSVITVNGNPVNLVAMPSQPGLRSVQWNFEDTVASVSYPFSGQTQTQEWAGADSWSGMMELPPLTQAELAPWKAFLMQLRGIRNGFMLGDPANTSPAGTVSSTSTPVVTGTNAAAAQSLTTTGWKPNQVRLLLAGDAFQIGYRLHTVLDTVNADGAGNATLAIWPALREVPAAGIPLILKSPKGLFRRAQNKQGWSADYTRISALSFGVMEYR